MELYRLQKLGQPLFDQCNVADAIVPVSSFQKRAAELPDTSLNQLLFDCKLHNVILKTGDFDLGWRSRERATYTYTDTKNILGVGGYGTVYSETVTSNKGSFDVAIKQFNAGTYDFNELDLLMRFKHPNVIAATDFFISGSSNQLNIVMPKAIMDLDHFMRQFHNEPRFTISVRARFIGELVNAMAFIQSQGFFHCDIKPENVLIMLKNPNGRPTFSNLKVVLADMSLCHPYSVGTEQPCGTEPYTALESKTTLSSDIVHPASYQAIQSQIQALTKTMLATDMFLLGNTCLYILAGRHFFGPYGTPDYQSSILLYLNNPEQYITDLFNDPASAGWKDWFAPLFAFIPSARPTEFLSLLKAPLTDLDVVPGFAAYEDFVSSPLLDVSIITKTMKFLIAESGLTFSTLRPEIQFSTLQMFYRIHAKMGINLSNPKSFQRVVVCCLDLACQLAYFESPITVPPNYLLKVVDQLNGQLRYSYIVECCHTPTEIEDIVKLGLSNPQKFLDLLHNPVAYFNNIRAARMAVKYKSKKRQLTK